MSDAPHQIELEAGGPGWMQRLSWGLDETVVQGITIRSISNGAKEFTTGGAVFTTSWTILLAILAGAAWWQRKWVANVFRRWLTEDHPSPAERRGAAEGIRKLDPTRLFSKFWEWLLKLFGKHEMARRVREARETADQLSLDSLRHTNSNNTALVGNSNSGQQNDRTGQSHTSQTSNHDRTSNHDDAIQTPAQAERAFLRPGREIVREVPADQQSTHPSIRGSLRSVRTRDTERSRNTFFSANSTYTPSIASDRSVGASHNDGEFTAEENRQFREWFKKGLDLMAKSDKAKIRRQRERALHLDGTYAMEEGRARPDGEAGSSQPTAPNDASSSTHTAGN